MTDAATQLFDGITIPRRNGDPPIQARALTVREVRALFPLWRTCIDPTRIMQERYAALEQLLERFVAIVPAADALLPGDIILVLPDFFWLAGAVPLPTPAAPTPSTPAPPASGPGTRSGASTPRRRARARTPSSPSRPS
jgi:hypothetical protein